MFKKLRKVVGKVVNKGLEVIENKVNGFVNASYEELNDKGNCLLIMGPITGISIGLIGLGLKIYANTKK